jgi:ABC-type transport system involved in multi-copper enzyme maturation permease subunit
MSTRTITPIRRRTPGDGQPVSRHGSFTRMLAAEWTKFFTVRGWVIGMVVGAILIVLFGVFLAANVSIGCGGTLSGAACIPKVPIGPGGEAVVDSYYIVRRPLTGNGTITVRVTSLSSYYANGNAAGPVGQGPATANLQKGSVPWAKAGIIIEASTRQGSAYAAMMVTGSHGVRMQWNYLGDTAGIPGAVTSSSPRWLRLTRTGGTIIGYDSTNGIGWTKVGTVQLTGLPPTVQSGLFVTSPLSTTTSQSFGGSSSQTGPSQSTAVFDSVILRGSWPRVAWAGLNIGQNRLSPGTGSGGFSVADSRFTVTGSGDIAPLVNGPGSGVPATTVQQPLTGVFAGLIAVVVIAAMFFTAEYRRGLIRVTLAASPQRGRVLAAKAAVVGSVAFGVGLVAALIAAWLGLPRERAQGQYVMPLSVLTDVRVIVGTAALVAVAAVFAVAVGAILRRSALAITTVIVAIVLPFLLAVAVLPASAGDWLLRVTPAAGFAIQQALPQYPQVDALYPIQAGYYPLGPWVGFGVLCGYAVLALVLAAFLLRRRDA